MKTKKSTTVDKRLRNARKALHDVQEILWPVGNPDAEWSSETIEDVARALVRHGFGPRRHR